VKPMFGQAAAGNGPSGAKEEDKSASNKTDEPAPKGDLMSMFKPKAGTWSCDTCMVSNPADKDKCVACETVKPGAKTGEKPKNDLMSMFKPKTGTWSCEVCMVSNPADKDKCLACETLKPGAKKTETNGKPAFGDSGGFKFGGTDSAPKSSGGFSFGSTSNTSSSGGGFGGFKFGSSSATSTESKESKPTGGFVFGASNGDKDKEDKDSGTSAAKFGNSLFKFGSSSSPKGSAAAPESSKPTDSTPGFSFGAKPTESSTKAVESSPFSFGTKTDSSGSSESTSASKSNFGGFTFGAKPADNEAKSDVNGKSTASTFSFGKSVDKAETTSFGSKKSFETASNTPDSIKSKDSANTNNAENSSDNFDAQYLLHLRTLNIQVTDWIKKHVDENPLVILSPIFKDYEKYIKELDVKFPEKPSPDKPSTETATQANQTKSPVKATEAIKPFSFGSTSEQKQDSTSTGFSFGSAASKPGGGFSFGLASAGTSTFAASVPSKPAEGSKAAKEEDEDEPPKVEVKEVVEEDALYSKRCKLFYKKDEKYVEKGVGMLHLKPLDTGKTQLLIRADTNLGNILLNINLNKDIPTTRLGKNNVMMVCIPNPPIDPKSTSNDPISMLIRVKSTEDADELLAKLDENKKK